ncbi:ArnT family glycosyltransferase [Porphyrobacter sp. AAP82]|uniref:ArnT family glycosyltransferase n=1 Tax=Porphyrobacter sp. AAP82 TaxID=1248917 RepID=UPI0002D4BE28|nr:glycosyltransferase family 39 protein [Porphyrobacter sp. AAP82]
MSSAIRPAPATAASAARKDQWIVLALALLTFFVRGAWIGDPNADVDEQLYSLIGNQMLSGAVPFVDLWDRKPWGLFALFAAFHAIGGAGSEAYQTAGALFTLAGAVMIFHLARAQADRMTAAAGAGLYVVLCTINDAHSGNSEVFFIPLLIAMAVLVRETGHPRAVGRAAVAMLIGGLALQIKYTIIPLCLFFGLWALWGQWQRGMKLGRLAALAAGFGVLGILPTALVSAGYWAAGHWDDYVFANFVSFFDRLPASTGRVHPLMLAYLGLQLSLSWLGFRAAQRIWPEGLPRDYVFVIGWLVAAVATAYLPATVYRHYLAALIPATALLALPLFHREPSERINRAALLPVAVFLLIVPYQYWVSHENRTATFRLAEAIAPHLDAEAGQCLLVFDGPTSLYGLTNSCLPTRLIYPDHLNNALEMNALGMRQEDEVRRILATRPPVIVTADQPLTPQNYAAKDQVDAAIRQDYRLLARQELHHRYITAWVRRQP